MLKCKASRGCQGADSPVQPFVFIDEADDFDYDPIGGIAWLTPAEARWFGKRLIKCADVAERNFVKYPNRKR
jgi:hypothetical protein